MAAPLGVRFKSECPSGRQRRGGGVLFQVVAALLALLPAKTFATDDPASTGNVTAYPASYFDDSRPTTAFDMLARLPGFTFDGGDPTVRGLDGSSGNVLIDGRRPQVKTDTLSDSLRRIPASSVLRIELIHGSVNGIDMEGRTVLANVVRRPEATTELATTGRLEWFSDGRFKPALRIDAARREGADEISGSVYAFTDESDDNGSGSRTLRAADGSLISAADVRVRFPDEAVYLRAGLQHGLFGGLIKASAAFNWETFRKIETERFIGGTGLDLFHTSDSTRLGELSIEYAHGFGQNAELKTTLLQSIKDEPDTSFAAQQKNFEVFTVRPQATESILSSRLIYRPSDALSFEMGAEAAYNFLKSATSFVRNGTIVPLPNARVDVSETRAEAITGAVWHPTTNLTIDAGARVEASRIAEAGDTKTAEFFLFPKPRLLLTWSPDSEDQLRLHVEREVGQLDFNQFAASADLAGGVVNAGNGNLRPARDWLYELSAEHHFWTKGSAVLTLARADIKDTIDELAVGGLNAPGNIGPASRQEVTAMLTIPLERLGITGGLLTSNLLWRVTSRVKDPTTATPRFISGDRPFEGSVTASGDIPFLHSAWTVGFVSGYVQRSFRIDEIDRTSYRSLVNLTWLYDAGSGLTAKLRYDYLPNRRRKAVRTVFGGLRNANPVAFTDALSLIEGTWAAVEIRKEF